MSAGNGKAPDSDAPESAAPDGDRFDMLERKVDAGFAEGKLERQAHDAKLQAQDEKLDRIIALVPTATERRAVLAFLALTVAAVVKHYTGIEIPIPTGEEAGMGVAGVATVAALISTVQARRAKAAEVAKKAAPLLVLLVVLSGCVSALGPAVDVANAGAIAGETAAPLVTEFCVEPMKAALASRDVGAARSIATRCDVPVEAYDTLRVVHVALRAAIVALASGRMPPDLPGLIVQVVDASAKLASSIGGLR